MFLSLTLQYIVELALYKKLKYSLRPVTRDIESTAFCLPLRPTHNDRPPKPPFYHREPPTRFPPLDAVEYPLVRGPFRRRQEVVAAPWARSDTKQAAQPGPPRLAVSSRSKNWSSSVDVIITSQWLRRPRASRPSASQSVRRGSFDEEFECKWVHLFLEI